MKPPPHTHSNYTGTRTLQQQGLPSLETTSPRWPRLSAAGKLESGRAEIDDTSNECSKFVLEELWLLSFSTDNVVVLIGAQSETLLLVEHARMAAK